MIVKRPVFRKNFKLGQMDGFYRGVNWMYFDTMRYLQKHWKKISVGDMSLYLDRRRKALVRGEAKLKGFKAGEDDA